jgi:SAM-dependent methyltransferase
MRVMSFASRLKRVVPKAFRPFAQAIYHSAFRFHLRLQCWFADYFGAAGSSIALPPAILRYRVSELLSADVYLTMGENCANLIRQCAYEMGLDLAGARRVLDFGCGCGRTARWFLRDDSKTEVYGVDVDEDAIQWCARHLPRGHFQVTEPLPPLPFPAQHFEVVFCVSVFTHLDESMQDLWLAELHRILKPQGVLILSIHSQRATSVLDADGLATLEAQGLVHRKSRKLRGLMPEWYNTTFHSREYIVKRISNWFGDVRYWELPAGLQDVVAGRRISVVTPEQGD